MNFLFNILIITILFIGCAKKTSPNPEIQTSTDIIKLEKNEKKVDNLVYNEIVIEVLDEFEQSEEKIEEVSSSLLEVNEPQNSIQKELDFDQLFPDSIWIEYMTKRGDYLSLIAYNEYNNANEWRRIYQWNREHWEEKGIGPDRDNPNFIYPYRELDLKKPANNAIEWAYDHYNYVVENGENLWTIAKKEYGDELAWVVLFWDNEEVLNSQDGKLISGMQLKIRSQLWPNTE